MEPHLRLVRDPVESAPALSPLSSETAPTPVTLSAAVETLVEADSYVDAQALAERHLAACQEALWSEDNGDAEVPESPACGPFCGCDTCIVREVLYAATPVLEAACRRELEAGLRVEIEARVRAELQIRPPGL